MSHSCRPESSHSESLLATASCNVPLRVQVCSIAWKSGSLKKKCWESLSRSEEHTSELQSLMRISYAVFCLKKKTQHSTARDRSDRSVNTSRANDDIFGY